MLTYRDPAALVQSVYAPALRAINALEQQIVEAEDTADAKLWEQARLVVEQLEAGLSQRELAKQWINLRTGEPYSQAHVSYTAHAYRDKHAYHQRPRFRDAYNAVAHGDISSGPANRLVFNSGETEWFTPAAYVDAAREVLGAIDLDPASCDTANTVVRARQFYTIAHDGLEQPWRGRIWLNPPYKHPEIEQFARKFARHVHAGDITAGIVLVNNSTDTEWFATFARCATAVCLLNDRVRFWHPDRETRTPLQGQATLYVGPNADVFCSRFADLGLMLRVLSP